MTSLIRTRFAPSPTGFLHLGGFRTALINYLFAKKHNGKFILRIEDTDQTRLQPKAAEQLEEDLCWLGLTPDESPQRTPNSPHGPYFQSSRLNLYHEQIGPLVDKGLAYECFCSETRLDLLRKDALRRREIPKYDNKCRNLTREEVKSKKIAGEKHCLRFKLNPGKILLQDLVYGEITFNLTPETLEGDPVLLKSDGFPTYHFANVVDDHFMGISHILRGFEWQSSAPKHLLLYKAFNWEPPKLAHLPLIINKDGTKLSKRQRDITMGSYRERSYYPLALANFVTKVGGGFEDHSATRIYSLEELSQLFELSKVGTNPGKLDMELLERFNQLELKRRIEGNLPEIIADLRHRLNTKSQQFSDSYLEKIIRWSSSQNRVSSLEPLLTNPDFAYLWSIPSKESLDKIRSSTEPKILEKFIQEYSKQEFGRGSIEDNNERIVGFLKGFAERNDLKFNTFMRGLRLSICGIEKGPPMAEILNLFGLELTKERLDGVLNALKIKSIKSQINS